MGEAKRREEATDVATAAALAEPVDPARTKWEYTTFKVAGANMEAGLNLAGSKGWEAWGVLGREADGIIIGFKRPKRLIDVIGSIDGIRL